MTNTAKVSISIPRTSILAKIRAKRGGFISGGCKLIFVKLARAFSPVVRRLITIVTIANPIPSFKIPNPYNGTISAYACRTASIAAADRYAADAVSTILSNVT